VVHLVVQQNLDEQSLDVIPPFLDVELLHLVDVAADAEPRHQLKMDCCQDVVDVELRHLHQMDCCLDVASEPLELELQVLEFQHFLPHALPPHALQPLLYLQSP
jgi:hypothetical protein